MVKIHTPFFIFLKDFYTHKGYLDPHDPVILTLIYSDLSCFPVRLLCRSSSSPKSP